MSSWSEGYVAEVGYTYGYYTELNPLRIAPALLYHGWAVPPVQTACELGFGQGVSINIHAAAQPITWWGTDFNPSHAAFAQELAAASGARATLSDEAFADFTRRPDLPDFDFIALHGVWTWISDENRRIIVDFIRRKLKVGGVVYVSYNTQPGWAAMVPLRELLTEHAEVFGADGVGIVSRIDGALNFAERLFAVNPAFARANPQVAERMKRIKEQNRNYLAHEYFNRDWHPMSFARMARRLQSAKLSWVCSAHLPDAVDAINLTAEQQQLLADIPDPMFRQSVRDFLVNQQFRRDYWIKGPRRLTGLEQAEALRRLRVVLVTHRSDVALKVTGALGEATLSEAVYVPILDLLADHRPRTLGEVEQAVREKGINFGQVAQAAVVLMGAGALAPAQEEALIAKAKKHTDRLNAHLCHRARGSGDMAYLASPVTGGGVPVPRFHQLFMLAARHGRPQPADWARFAWDILAAQGQRLVKEGRALESAEENLGELTAQAKTFAEKHLPVLKALHVAS